METIDETIANEENTLIDVVKKRQNYNFHIKNCMDLPPLIQPHKKGQKTCSLFSIENMNMNPKRRERCSSKKMIKDSRAPLPSGSCNQKQISTKLVAFATCYSTLDIQIGVFGVFLGPKYLLRRCLDV